MEIIIWAIVIMLLDFGVCYLCGRLIQYRFYKGKENPLMDIIVGFLFLQIGFEILTLLFFWKNMGLGMLSYTWLFIVCVLCLCSFLLIYKGRQQKKQRKIKKIGTVELVTIIVVAVFCFFVTTHGELNDDSRYYIALVNTTLSTEKIFQYNPYNGIWGDAWLGRRALVTFEVHSAMLCYLFRIPALVMTRVVRASQNVILTSMAVWLCGKEVFFHKDEKAQTKSCELVIINLLLQIFFSNTIYTNATFFMFRGYEGKAFTANLLVIFTLYLCTEIIRQKKGWPLILVLIWGSAAISSSAMVVVPMETGMILLSYVIVQAIRRKRKNYAGC